MAGLEVGNSAATANLPAPHSGLFHICEWPISASTGSFVMYLPASSNERDELASARERNRFVKSTFPDQLRLSIGSRSRFMVNSIFCDCRWRQLSTSVR